jgi:hypothetical protein
MFDFLKNKEGDDGVPPDVGREDEYDAAKKEDSDESNEKEEIKLKSISTKKQKKETNTSFRGNEQVELERLGAKLDSVVDWINQFYERFSYVSENIGELRAMNLENEKKISKSIGEAERVIDIVKEVHPEKLTIDYQKLEMKIKALEERIEANKQLQENLISEIKDLKNRSEMFVGTESLLKLNEDTKHDIMGLKKLDATVRMNADKCEQIFVEIKKGFIEDQRLSSTVSDLENNLNKLKEDQKRLRLDYTKVISQEEFSDLKKTVENRFRVVDNYLASIDDMKDLHEQLTNLVEKLIRMTRSNKEDIENIAITIGDDNIRRISDYEAQLVSLLKITDTLAGQIAEIKEKVGMSKKKIQVPASEENPIDKNRINLQNINIHPSVAKPLIKKSNLNQTLVANKEKQDLENKRKEQLNVKEQAKKIDKKDEKKSNDDKKTQRLPEDKQLKDLKRKVAELSSELGVF